MRYKIIALVIGLVGVGGYVFADIGYSEEPQQQVEITEQAEAPLVAEEPAETPQQAGEVSENHEPQPSGQQPNSVELAPVSDPAPVATEPAPQEQPLEQTGPYNNITGKQTNHPPDLLLP